MVRDQAGILCFVEVKTRREKSGQSIHPAWAVHDAKQQRLRKAAASYLRALATPALTTRFDVIEVYGSPESGRPVVDHIDRVALFAKGGRFVKWK